jgi:hypothetical protein
MLHPAVRTQAAGARPATRSVETSCAPVRAAMMLDITPPGGAHESQPPYGAVASRAAAHPVWVARTSHQPCAGQPAARRCQARSPPAGARTDLLTTAFESHAVTVRRYCQTFAPTGREHGRSTRQPRPSGAQRGGENAEGPHGLAARRWGTSACGEQISGRGKADTRRLTGAVGWWNGDHFAMAMRDERPFETKGKH